MKIEADTHIYRPFTSQLEAWPRLNVDTPRGSCPFDGTLIAQGDRSREERGELLAAQVDVSTPDTPQEEKDDIASGARTHTKSVEYVHRYLIVCFNANEYASRKITLTWKYLLPVSFAATLKGKNLLPMGAKSFLLEWP